MPTDLTVQVSPPEVSPSSLTSPSPNEPHTLVLSQCPLPGKTTYLNHWFMFSSLLRWRDNFFFHISIPNVHCNAWTSLLKNKFIQNTEGISWWEEKWLLTSLQKKWVTWLCGTRSGLIWVLVCDLPITSYVILYKNSWSLCFIVILSVKIKKHWIELDNIYDAFFI